MQLNRKSKWRVMVIACYSLWFIAFVTSFVSLADRLSPATVITALVLTLLFFILAYALGLMKSVEGHEFDGTMVIDKTDPMKDYYSLELDISLTELDHRKSVYLEIQNGSDS